MGTGAAAALVAVVAVTAAAAATAAGGEGMAAGQVEVEGTAAAAVTAVPAAAGALRAAAGLHRTVHILRFSSPAAAAAEGGTVKSVTSPAQEVMEMAATADLPLSGAERETQTGSKAARVDFAALPQMPALLLAAHQKTVRLPSVVIYTYIANTLSSTDRKSVV